MKSIQNKKNIWKKIDNVVLRVDNIDLKYEKDIEIYVDCGFENISKGRCKLTIRKKNKKIADNLFIHSDKALMEVSVYYNLSIINELIRYLSYKKNSTKKIKVSLKILDSLMTNDSGDLYINNKTKIKIDSIIWNIPVL
tara:strand:- start:245 stop:661 length:417 start_codon:yes stop_codon:yes gene_type:complete